MIIKLKLSIIYLGVHTEEIKSIFQLILQINDSLQSIYLCNTPKRVLDHALLDRYCKSTADHFAQQERKTL